MLLSLSEAAGLQLPAPDLLHSGQKLEDGLFSRLDRAAGESQLPANRIQQVTRACVSLDTETVLLYHLTCEGFTCLNEFVVFPVTGARISNQADRRPTLRMDT